MKFDDTDPEFDDSAEDYENVGDDDVGDSGNGDDDGEDGDSDNGEGDDLEDVEGLGGGVSTDFDEDDDDKDYIVDTVGNKPMFADAVESGPMEGDASHPGHLDMRVGVIEEVFKHPDVEDHLVEVVNVGNYDESFLQASSLLKRYKEFKYLKNKKVIICCNVEPLESRHIGSKTGALLVATRYHITTKGRALGEYCELLEPPDDSEPGDRVYVEGYNAEPYPYSPDEVFAWMVKDFRVDSTGQVVYKDKPLKVEGVEGVVRAEEYFDCEVRLD